MSTKHYLPTEESERKELINKIIGCIEGCSICDAERIFQDTLHELKLNSKVVVIPVPSSSGQNTAS